MDDGLDSKVASVILVFIPQSGFIEVTGHVGKYGNITTLYEVDHCDGPGNKGYRKPRKPKYKRIANKANNNRKAKETKIEPSAINRTNGHILIYNRVPKCGSTTLISIVSKLHLKNNNNFGYCTSFEQRRLKDDTEKDFLEWLTVKSTMENQHNGIFAMDRHFYFVDKNNYNLGKGKLNNYVTIKTILSKL